MILNKVQSDLLGWTDKTDPNDVIILDDKGNIVHRRPVLALNSSGSFNAWYKLTRKGKWKYKTDKK